MNDAGMLWYKETETLDKTSVIKKKKKHRVCGTLWRVDVGLLCAEYAALQNGLPIIKWREIVEDDLGVEGVKVMLCFVASLCHCP